MKTQPFYLEKNIQPDSRSRIVGNIHSLIAALPITKKWKITVGLDRETRSDKQNAYLWAAVYPAIREQYRDMHNIDRAEEIWHEYFKLKYITPMIEEVKGAPVSIYKSTTKLTPVEFFDYVDLISAEAADDGVVVPPPVSIKREEKKKDNVASNEEIK